MFPDKAILYLAAIEDDEYRYSKLDFWDSIYNVKMSCIKNWVIKEPLVDIIDERQINGETVKILEIDLKQATIEDLNFEKEFKMKINRKDYVHGLVGWYKDMIII